MSATAGQADGVRSLADRLGIESGMVVMEIGYDDDVDEDLRDLLMDRVGDFVEIVMDETPLRRAMLTFSRNILILSLFISVLTAALVYLTLNLMFVRPMRRLTDAMVAFRENPEDLSRTVVPSGPA